MSRRIAVIQSCTVSQARKSDIEVAAQQLTGALGNGPGGRRHVAARLGTQRVAGRGSGSLQSAGAAGAGAGGERQQPPSTLRGKLQQPAALRDAPCRHGPHRRQFSAKELALQQERYAAWQRGELHGLAMCLVVKGVAVARSSSSLRLARVPAAWRCGCGLLGDVCNRGPNPHPHPVPAADQAEDLAEWVEYHLALGADHVYVYDTGSRPPVKWALRRFREVSRRGAALLPGG